MGMLENKITGEQAEELVRKLGEELVHKFLGGEAIIRVEEPDPSRFDEWRILQHNGYFANEAFVRFYENQGLEFPNGHGRKAYDLFIDSGWRPSELPSHEYELIVVELRDLGFHEETKPLTVISKAKKTFGLECCSLDIIPEIALHLVAEDEELYVAIDESHKETCIVKKNEIILGPHPKWKWDLKTRIIFIRPKRDKPSKFVL